MPKLDHDTLELLLIAVTAICILVQTVLLSVVFISVHKAIKALSSQADDFRASAMPAINNTREFVQRIAPKVEETAKNLAELSRSLKKNATEISQTIKEGTTQVSVSAVEIAQRANAQSSRIDSMVTGALDGLDHAAVFVVDAVNKPIRQISGLLASVKAIVEVLGAPQPPRRNSQRASQSVDEHDPQSEPVI
jgi:ABC-type transporter Mla subunit MlaD